MSKGIVVDHREARVRFAISEENFNPDKHKRVRDLRPEETVLGYKPRHISRLGEAETSEEDAAPQASTQRTSGAASDAKVVSGDSSTDTQTEGSATAGTKG